MSLVNFNNFIYVVRTQAKELLKVVVIVYTLVSPKKLSSIPLIFRKLVSMSPFSPLLAFKVPYIQEIIKYQAREIDLLVVLLFDGIMESANQVLLVVYFALYINKTGLDATNVLSIINNSFGLLFKLVKVIHIYFTRRKEAALRLSTVTGSPTSSVTMDSLTEKKRKETSSSPPAAAASIEMINVAFQVDVQSGKIGKIAT